MPGFARDKDFETFHDEEALRLQQQQQRTRLNTFQRELQARSGRVGQIPQRNIQVPQAKNRDQQLPQHLPAVPETRVQSRPVIPQQLHISQPISRPMGTATRPMFLSNEERAKGYGRR